MLERLSGISKQVLTGLTLDYRKRLYVKYISSHTRYSYGDINLQMVTAGFKKISFYPVRPAVHINHLMQRDFYERMYKDKVYSSGIDGRDEAVSLKQFVKIYRYNKI